MAHVNSTKDTLKKSRLRDRTDSAWFSRLLQHPAGKCSRSIHTTLGACTGLYIGTDYL